MTFVMRLLAAIGSRKASEPRRDLHTRVFRRDGRDPSTPLGASSGTPARAPNSQNLHFFCHDSSFHATISYTAFPPAPQEDNLASGNRFLLELALDASQVSNFNAAYQVKVVAYPKQGEAYERIVNFSSAGRGSALVSVSEAPGALKLAVWPEAVSQSDQDNLRTISFDVPASSWQTSSEVKLPGIAISDYFWDWWLHLTRNFGVEREPVCASGCPALSSPITVYDVDTMWQ